MADVRDVLGMSGGGGGGAAGASGQRGVAPASAAGAGAASAAAAAAVPRELALLKSEFGWGGAMPLAPTIAPAAFFKAKRGEQTEYGQTQTTGGWLQRSLTPIQPLHRAAATVTHSWTRRCTMHTRADRLIGSMSWCTL